MSASPFPAANRDLSSIATANILPPEIGHRHHRSSSRSFIEGVTLGRGRQGSYSRYQPNETTLAGVQNSSAEHAGSSRQGRRRRSVDVGVIERKDPEASAVANRWSHSSTSSVANTRRSRASSGATFAPLVSQHMSPSKRDRAGGRKSPQLSPTRVPSSNTRQALPAQTSPKIHRTNPLTALPPLLQTPSLTEANNVSPSTTPMIASPDLGSAILMDYFGTNQSPRATKERRPTASRSQTNPRPPDPPANTEGALESLRKTRTAETPDMDRRPSTPYDSHGQRRPKTRDGRDKDKKTMLSKALQKANTAVLLDNAQNFEGALDAYHDACRLLQHVMDCSNAHDDKRKLEAIQATYTNRIAELQELESEQPSGTESKTLPARPRSDDSFTGVAAGSVAKHQPEREAPLEPSSQQMRPQYFASEHNDVSRAIPFPASDRQEQTEPVFSITKDPQSLEQQLAMAIPARAVPPLRQPPQPVQTRDAAHAEFMPTPLFQRKPPAADAPVEPNNRSRPPLPDPVRPDSGTTTLPPLLPEPTEPMNRGRAQSTNSNTWLNTIDESASDASSVHSISSRSGVRRKHIRGISGVTDPDFDAAFDAAVEAAYDEGFEPDLDMQRSRPQVYGTLTEHIRHAQNNQTQPSLNPIPALEHYEYPATTAADEAEERLLESFTSDTSILQTFNFEPTSTKPNVPRASDSSGYSRSTWQSSHASSDRATAVTSLSTVAEDAFGSLADKLGSLELYSPNSNSSPSVTTTSTPIVPPPPPNASLPPLPKLPVPPVAANLPAVSVPTVRSRRLSGQNSKTLKIETSVSQPEPRKRASTFHHSPSSALPSGPESEPFEIDIKFGSEQEMVRSAIQPSTTIESTPVLDLRSAVSDSNIPSFSNASSSLAPNRREDDPSNDFLSARPVLFRKNKSSLSLRNEHTLLVSPTETHAPPLFTPMSATFMSFSSKRSEDPRESQRAKFSTADIVGSAGNTSGIHLFDTSLNASNRPLSPRSPPFGNQHPANLEPCPEPFLLRPFWLMRTLGTTITHNTGGFLTTRLFVPREVWMTKGVKLKAVEDKIANCDLLTAALGRLSGVDTYDADAIMEELQNFEDVMERTQTTLTKKLGGDVGVQTIAGLFKDAPPATTSAASVGSDASSSIGEKSRSKESKGSYLSSWRKLRNKSSGATSNSHQVKRGEEREVQGMASVPMTTFVPVERRGLKKDARNAFFDGPNKDYMGSLARLFEGAQILDQIARQVEDPGLKHSSQTHVGLELSMRHAAEFFGFFICRFVLADLTLLLDKYVKRGTEWSLT